MCGRFARTTCCNSVFVLKMGEDAGDLMSMRYEKGSSREGTEG